jgi:glycosyltransferase involved in cell wall biosynthesis
VRGVELIVYRYAPHPALAVWGYAESLHADVKVRRTTLLALPFGILASLYALVRQILIARPDVIHAHWLLPNGLPALIASRLFGIPLVVSMHGSDVSMAERNVVFRWIAQRIFSHTRAATACSGDLHRRALALGADPETTVVLPYGVTISSFAPEYADRDWVSQRFGVPVQSPLLVAVGRFVHKKGFAVLIHAMIRIREHFPNVRLVLAGYGDLLPAYQRAVEERGLSDVVILPGQLSRDDVARLIASADIYCVPSVHDESGNVDGLPNTLLEGMSAGTAIVASAIAGIPDVLSDGHDALLVPAADEVALADACVRLLGDPPLRNALGIAARQRVLRGLTWPAMTETLVRMYAKVRSL